MGRQLRFDPPGGLHHVMHRGSRRQLIFEEDHDRRRFLHRLRETCERSNVVVHAFALMPNHYHLLLECPEGGLSLAMKYLNSVYAQDFNWRHSYDGHLFRGRFRSLLVDGDPYFVEVARYIHRNSVAASLATTPIDDPWNSHGFYLCPRGPSWLMTERVLAYFDNDRARFDAFVNAPDSARARAVIEAVDARRPAVGRSEFLRELQVAAPEDKELVHSASRLIPVDLAGLASFVTARLVASPTGGSIRQVDVCLCVARRLGVPVSDLHRCFGFRNEATVRTRIRRLEQRAKDDGQLADLLSSATKAADPSLAA